MNTARTALLSVVLVSTFAWASPPTRVVDVVGPRVHLRELIPNVSEDNQDVDLGPVPSPGATVVMQKSELARAIASQGRDVPKNLPEAIRVRRKMKRIPFNEMNEIVRDSLSKANAARGMAINEVRAASSVDIPDGYTQVSAIIPKPPKRLGKFLTTVTLTFEQGTVAIAHVNVPVDFTLSSESMQPEVPKGTSISLMIQKGLVEVTTPGVASADSEIGSVVPIMLRPSGRMVRAKLIDKSHAVAIEGP